jgi:hypothetical protein
MFQVSSLRRKEGGRYGADRPERHRPEVILAYYEVSSQLYGLVPDVTPALALVSGLIGALPKTALSLPPASGSATRNPRFGGCHIRRQVLPLRSTGCVGLSIDDRLVPRPLRAPDGAADLPGRRMEASDGGETHSKEVPDRPLRRPGGAGDGIRLGSRWRAPARPPPAALQRSSVHNLLMKPPKILYKSALSEWSN